VPKLSSNLETALKDEAKRVLKTKYNVQRAKKMPLDEEEVSI
jgi:hypothetical protein